MKKIVMVIKKTVKNAQKPFDTYSLLSASGAFYRTSKVDVKVLEPNAGKIVAAEVSRLFQKDVTKKDGEVVQYPTLVVESISAPTKEEEKDFVEKLRIFNEKSLADFK